MCEICKFLTTFQDMDRSHVAAVDVRIVAPTVQRAAQILRETADILEQEYAKLDGRSVVGITSDSVVTIEYEHINRDDFKRSTHDEQNTKEKAKHGQSFVSGNKTDH